MMWETEKLDMFQETRKDNKPQDAVDFCLAWKFWPSGYIVNWVTTTMRMARHHKD